MAAPARVYFLTSRSQPNDYVLPVYALSGAAGLLGSSAACSGSPISPRPPAPRSRSWFPFLLIVRSFLWPERCPPRGPSTWAG